MFIVNGVSGASLHCINFGVAMEPSCGTGNFLGLLLLGGTIISIGLLISSLTESQFIAALGTFTASFLFWMIDSLGAMFSGNAVIGAIVNFLSLNQRYNDFTLGVIHYDNVIFFLSIQVLFVFLTVRVLDRKRWS